ncbi:MAG: helix-turn-helix domain-containing protein [Lachnospiraceae bacterium]
MINIYDQSKIGEKIKKLRNDHGESQEELAEIVPTSRQSLAKWENGRVIPQLADLLSICNHYDCTLEYLLGERKTINNEIENAMAYTGLSDEAILTLHNMLKSNDDIVLLPFISDMLEHKMSLDLYYFLKELWLYRFKISIEGVELTEKEIQENLDFLKDEYNYVPEDIDKLASQQNKRVLSKREYGIFLADNIGNEVSKIIKDLYISDKDKVQNFNTRRQK